MPILMIGNAISESVNPNAELMAIGREQTRILGRKLVAEYGIDVPETRVATSQTRQSQETAILAGFCRQRHYAQLGNVYQDPGTTHDRRKLPLSTVEAVEDLLFYPPNEQIWITDPILIGATCRMLNVYQDRNFIPDFCEIREFHL